MKKKIIFSCFFLLSLCVTLASVLALTLLISEKNGVIKTIDSNYIRIYGIVSAGPYLAVRRSPSNHQTRDKAAAETDSSRSISLINLETVETIDFTLIEDKKPLSQGSRDNWNISIKECLGEYRLNAAGNNGILNLYARGGAVYGTVRFPGWGKGAVEPLKNLRISNGTISFTRSAQTKAELDKVGTNTPFSQQYQGSYLHSGKTIKGTYMVQGSKKNWEAYR